MAKPKAGGLLPQAAQKDGLRNIGTSRLRRARAIAFALAKI
jgi:hypothetical protein